MEFAIYLAKSAAILSLFYLVYIFFLKNDTLFTAKRFFFLFGIIAALALPLLEFTTIIEIEAPVAHAVTNVENYIPVFQENQIISTQNMEPVIDWLQLGMIIYISFIIFFLARFIIRLFSLKSLLKRHSYKKINSLRYVKINEDISPFSIFNYIVFNPNLHTTQELEMILKHERIHARQWHTTDIILGQLITIIQWANPFSWAYKKALEANLEYIADNKTITQLESKKAYQLALINASSSFIAPALSSPFYQSLIKKRIIMLNKKTSHRRNLLKVSIVFPLLALFLFSFNVKEEIKYVTATDVATAAQKIEILPTATNDELNSIAAYFKKNNPSTLVRIKNVNRDANGIITSFDFQTKFDGDKEFRTRFSQKEVEDKTSSAYLGHTIEYAANVLNISEIGPRATKFKITKDRLEFNNTDFLTPFIDASKKQFTITSETSELQLKAIQSQLEDQSDAFEVLFKNLERNANGQITQLSINTKFKGQPRFYNNVTYGDNQLRAPIASLQLSVKNNQLYFGNTDGSMWNKITEDGVMALAFQKKTETTDGGEDLGENPLYIVNGKYILKNDLPKNFHYKVSDEIEILFPKEAVKKYGAKAKDGVFVFKGTTTFESEIDASNKSEATNISEEKSSLNDTLAQKNTPKTTYRFNSNAANAPIAYNPSANTSLTNKKQNKTAYSYATKSATFKEGYQYRITKNTTNAELKAIKTAFAEEHKGSFDYKVKRNSANEITAISIHYNDGNGNTGSYDVKHNNTPIKSIVIYKNEKGTFVVGADSTTNKETTYNTTSDRPTNTKERMEQKRAVMEQRREKLEEARDRTEEIKERMDSRREKIEEQREELEAQREKLLEQSNALRETSRSIAETSTKINTVTSNGKNANEDIYITKNTTDSELQQIKNALAAKGVDFSYRKVRRNRNGEITAIKINVNNGKGSKQNIASKSNNSKPIDDIVIEI